MAQVKPFSIFEWFDNYWTCLFFQSLTFSADEDSDHLVNQKYFLKHRNKWSTKSRPKNLILVFCSLLSQICYQIWIWNWPFKIEPNVISGETQSCSTCRRQPQPCRRQRCATCRAPSRQRRRPVGGGRGGPCWATPWTARTSGWSTAPWPSLSQLKKKGNIYSGVLGEKTCIVIIQNTF